VITAFLACKGQLEPHLTGLIEQWIKWGLPGVHPG
jgi:hypothetical protein